MKVINITRIFRFNDNGTSIIFDDPNPNLTPNEVRDLYAGQYPALTNSVIESKGVENDKEIIEFNSVLGTKA